MITVGHAERTVTPLGFCGPLDASVGPGLYANRMAGGPKQTWSGPAGMLDAGTTPVLQEANVAGRVAAKQIHIAVPIKAHWRSHRAEIWQTRLLPKVKELSINGHSPGSPTARVFDESDATIFVAIDSVKIAVAIPIDHHGRDHLKVHLKRVAILGEEADTRFELWRLPAGGVPKPYEAVGEFTADEIEIAITVEVSEIGRRPTKDLDRAVAGKKSDGKLPSRSVGGANVADQIYKAAQWPICRLTSCAVGIVPAVLSPVVDSDDQVECVVVIEIGVAPHVGANAVWIDVDRTRQRRAMIETSAHEVHGFGGGREDVWSAIDVTDLNILHATADAARRARNRGS